MRSIVADILRPIAASIAQYLEEHGPECIRVRHGRRKSDHAVVVLVQYRPHQGFWDDEHWVYPEDIAAEVSKAYIELCNDVIFIYAVHVEDHSDSHSQQLEYANPDLLNHLLLWVCKHMVGPEDEISSEGYKLLANEPEPSTECGDIYL